VAGIKEIAIKAGVSIGTVDRVLHNRGRCAAATKELVLTAAKELDYQPNLNARRLKRNETFRILVLMAKLHQDQGYWKVPLSGIERAKSEFQAIGVDIVIKHYDRYSTKDFEKASLEIKRIDYNAVLLAPLLPEASKQLMAQHPHLPFATFDCPLLGVQPWLSVLQDPFLGGVAVARLMSYMVAPNDPIAVISYDSPNPHIALRVRGFNQIFADMNYKTPDHWVIPDEFNLKELKAYLKERAIDLPSYKAIFVAKTGVHKYAECLNPQQRPLLIGYDLIERNIDSLKNHKIDFLISQNSSAQTYQAIRGLVNSLLDGKEQAHVNLPMPIDIITQDNIDLYLSNH